MTYLVTPITGPIYGLALWDEAWKAHNNCYLIKTEGQVTLIDCGKVDHTDLLVEALAELGVQPGDVHHLIATHGHADHVGAAGAFPNATRWIHQGDLDRLKPHLQAQFTERLPDDGEVLGLPCVHLGQHTAGSVALFHPKTGVLFAGDHICFFGGELPPEGLVAPAPELRARWTELAASFASEDDATRQKYSLDLFAPGVEKLRRFPARYLATGHGAVLEGELDTFLDDLLAAAGR